MKRLFLICISALLLVSFSATAYAASAPLAPQGEKVVFSDGTWAYEKVNISGWEIDEYVGDAATADVPYSFAKEYITSIGSYAFNRNTNLTAVNTTYKIETIGEYAFNGCTALETVTLYDALTAIGVGCFYGDSSLKQINMQDTSLAEIPAYCFADCGIEAVELPETCTHIGNYAFYQCALLENIIIPVSVTAIEDTAFINCDNLTIYCYRDSYAHNYAAEQNIPYVLLDDATEPVGYFLGDADGNDAVESTDATWVQRYSARMVYPMSYETLMQADVDRDGFLSVTDATFIQRYIAKIPTVYPIGDYIS